MKHFFTRTKQLLILGMLMPLLASADFYIRKGGGSGTGADWNSTLDDLPATLIAGNTYYLADGNYSDRDISQSGTSGNEIILKKATVDDHGTEVGWDNTYGDGESVFGYIGSTGDYVIVDGVTMRCLGKPYRADGIIYMYANNCEIKNVTAYLKRIEPTGDPYAGDYGQPYGFYIRGNNNTMRDCLIDGEDVSVLWVNGSFCYASAGTGNTLINCSAQDCVDQDFMRAFGDAHVIGGYAINFLNPNYDVSGPQGQGKDHTDWFQTFDNEMDLLVERVYVSDFSYSVQYPNGGQLGNCTLSDPGGQIPSDATSLIFQNCVFIRTAHTIFVGVPNTKFFNCTFYKVAYAHYSDPIAFWGTSHGLDYQVNLVGGCEVRNCLILECGSDSPTVNGMVYDEGLNTLITHNYYAGAGYVAKTSPEGTSYVNGGDPGLTDIGNDDFTLLETSQLRNQGVDLSAYFTDDINGNTRSAWDIGAYAYTDGGSTVATPVITQAEGAYWFDQSTTITCTTPGASIYYTTDGSTPSAGSTLYTTPITIDQPMTIKAIGILVDYNDSAIATSVYEVGEWVGSVAWKSFLVTDQTDTFSFSMNVTPTSSDIDLVMGFNDSQISGYEGCLVGLRFSYLGVVDARNGAIYDAENVFNYGAQTYTIAGTVNLTTDTYSFTVNGTTIANNYSFRDSGTLANVEWFGLVESENTSPVTVSNLQFGEAPDPPTHLRQVKAASYIMNTFQ